MKTANGCTLTKVRDTLGTVYLRTPYENEMVEPERRIDHRCHDCGVKFYQIHHNGCDMERCPKCGGQFIWCGCDDVDKWELIE
jgi:rRNA maturation endonuclease Nob1